MSDAQFRKDLARLLNNFQPQQMQWPDIVESLRKLKSLLQGNPSLRVPEPVPLSESLMKCLHPSLPQGLHIEALEVYDLLLFPGTPTFDAELACYVNALFSFYEFAAPENKLSVLRTFHRLVDAYAGEVGFFMPGLVFCVLQGLEDPGNSEARPQIVSLFERLGKPPGTFHAALWAAILRSDTEGRYGALGWLHRQKQLFIPNRQLVLNALMACLEDQDPRVRRSTLDLVKEQVSILSKDKLLDEEKVALLVAALRSSGRMNDASIVRRIKEWVVSGEYTAEHNVELSGYCAKAADWLLEEFSQTEEEVRTSKAALRCLLTILDDTPELQCLLLGQLSFVLIMHVYKNSASPCFHSLQALISEFVTAETSVQAWESLSYELSITLTTPRLAEVLNLIVFALNNLSCHECANSLYTISRLILEQFEALPRDCQSQALEIVQVLCWNAEVTPKDTGFQQCLRRLAVDSSDQLQTAMNICIALEEPGDWLAVVTGLFESGAEKQVLLGIQGMLYVHSKPAFEAYREGEVPKRAFDLLWSRLSFPVANQVVQLLAAWLALSDSGFSSFLCEKLVSLSPSHIQQFSAAWSGLKRRPESLECFRSGEEIFLLLEGLESASPPIRHAVREWLLDSLHTAAAIFDPFIEPLIEFSFTQTNQHQSYYVHRYGQEYILLFLKKLRMLLLHGGDKLYAWVEANSLSVRLRSLCSEDCCYLAMILSVSLQLVHTESQTVQLAACEVVERVLDRGNVLHAAAAGTVCLGATIKAIQEGNSLFQLQLLGILSTSLLICHNSNSVPSCQALFGSPDLPRVLACCVASKSAYLRSHWTEFVCQIFPVALRWMSGTDVIDCTKQLIHAFAEVIRTEEAKDDAFRGLTKVLTAVVSLSERKEDLEFVKEYTQNQVKESSGLFSSLFSSKQQKPAGTPFDALHNSVICCFEEILQACQACLHPRELHFHASPKGLLLTHKDPALWPGDQCGESIRAVLFPLFCKWQTDFLAASVSLWLTNSKKQADSSDLDNLIRLFAVMGLSPTEVLGSLACFLAARIDNFWGISEVELIYFLATLLLSYPAEAYPQVQEEKQVFAEALLRVVEELDAKLGAKDEVKFWLIEFIVYLNRLFPFPPILNEKPMKLKLQKVVKALLSTVYLHCCDTLLVRPPFPPSLFQLGPEPLCTQAAAFRVLCVHLSPLLILAYEGRELKEQLRAPITMLTKGLAERNTPIHMLTALLHSLIKVEGEFVTGVLRDSLKSTLNKPEFFKSLLGDVNALRQWGQIVESLVLSDSRDSDQVLIDVLDGIPAGLLTTKEEVLKGTLKAFKTVAFYIYSGKENCYAKALPELLKRLTRPLEGETLPSVFLVLRALALHLSHTEWEHFYIQLRPYLMTRLTHSLNSSEIDVKAAAMKLLELLIALGYQQFLSSEWLFVYASPNIVLRPGRSSAFQPIAASSLLPSYRGVLEPCDQTDLSVHSQPKFSLRPTPRQLFFKATDSQDLQGQSFLQYTLQSCLERLTGSRLDLKEVFEFDLLQGD